MIVQCSQCQTRFRIPDEKVTERGVKVRCTRCQHTFRVSRDGPQEGGDPFAGFGPGVGPSEHEATRPGVDAQALAASRPQGENTRVMSQAHAAEQLARMEAAELPLPRPPQVATPSVPRPPSMIAPADVPRPPSLDLPFAVPGPSGPSVPERAGFDVGMDFSADDDPFADLPLDPPPQATGVGLPADPFAGLPPAKSPTDPFGGLPHPVSPTLPFGQRGSGAAPASGAAALGLFDEEASGHGPEANTDLRSELFGAGLDAPDRPMPEVGAEPLLDLPAPTREVAFAAPGVQRVKLKLAEPSPTPTPELSPVPPPSALARTGSGARGLLVNLLLGLLLVAITGAVLLALANEGNVSLDAWRGRLLPVGPLVARDVSNGLYTTRTGEAVFFVRGEVENTGTAPLPAEVRVEIYDGDTLLRSAVARVGAGATPEDLHDLTTEEDVRALRERLDHDAEALAPGALAPFVVAFLDYPPALERYRFQILPGPASERAPAAAEEGEDEGTAPTEPVSEASDA